MPSLYKGTGAKHSSVFDIRIRSCTFFLSAPYVAHHVSTQIVIFIQYRDGQGQSLENTLFFSKQTVHIIDGFYARSILYDSYTQQQMDHGGKRLCEFDLRMSPINFRHFFIKVKNPSKLSPPSFEPKTYSTIKIQTTVNLHTSQDDKKEDI